MWTFVFYADAAKVSIIMLSAKFLGYSVRFWDEMRHLRLNMHEKKGRVRVNYGKFCTFAVNILTTRL